MQFGVLGVEGREQSNTRFIVVDGDIIEGVDDKEEIFSSCCSSSDAFGVTGLESRRLIWALLFATRSEHSPG